MRRRSHRLLCLAATAGALLFTGSGMAHADTPGPQAEGGQWDDLGYHPWFRAPKVGVVDLSPEARARNEYVTDPVQQPSFWSLDDHALPPELRDAPPPAARDEIDDLQTSLPEGWVQKGNVVLPRPVTEGFEVDPGVSLAVQDLPGNQYPRKHTLFLNFSGGMLYTGADNSAEDKSTLAKQGVYPTFGGGEQVALSIIQAVEADVGPYGIRVMYESRPRKVVPYTMEMVGGSWTDTNIDSPAGGVAPGADCGALGQRHVVYTFSNGGSVLGAAATISQEAGHAWGLDHTFNCSSVMSYCGSGDKAFQTGCDDLCESQCQGPNSAGCRLTHEMFCGEGSDQQDDSAEMEWIFGGNEPDMEPPTVEIVEPEDGLELEEGDGFTVRALVDDNYGGFGWKFVVVKDGETIYDMPDYHKDNIDDQYRAALGFSGLEPGTYEVTVEAEDQYEHVTADTITVIVGGGAPGTGGNVTASGTDGSDDDSGGVDETGLITDTDASGTGDAGTGGGITGPDQMGDDDKGCACSATGGAGGGSAAWLLLGLVGAIRLRRRG